MTRILAGRPARSNPGTGIVDPPSAVPVVTVADSVVDVGGTDAGVSSIEHPNHVDAGASRIVWM